MSEQLFEFTPEIEYVGERLDKYISVMIDGISRSYIQKLTDEGKVTIIDTNNTSRSVKASYKLRSKDKVKVLLPEPEKLDILPENIPLDIVYEDDDLIVIEKPQGMVVHPAAGNYTGTLVNALMYHCGDRLSSINGVERPGIVHRIDKDTSGLLVVCKTDKAHQSLAEQFEKHSIHRIYSCIVYNHFDIDKLEKVSIEENPILRAYSFESQNVSELMFDNTSDFYTLKINKPINRGKNDRKKMVIDPDGRRAVTHVFLKENLKDNFSYIKCKLETGRTHQIRVHLASINHPLLGDDVYGPKKCPFNLKGQVLHAGTLGFIHPVTGEYMEFKSELPGYFNKLLIKYSEKDND
ncbi:MAG: RluA family pseudouridine synthase [Eubacterium sp.]|nr:RluA family pseudouridine synthase [Eubacterium sp.]